MYEPRVNVVSLIISSESHAMPYPHPMPTPTLTHNKTLKINIQCNLRATCEPSKSNNLFRVPCHAIPTPHAHPNSNAQQNSKNEHANNMQAIDENENEMCERDVQ